MGRKKPKIDGGFIVLPRNTIKDDKFRSLNAHSKSVLLAILTKFIRDGKANPDNLVEISHREIMYLSGETHSSTVRAVKELKEKDFMRVKTAGGLGTGRSIFQLNGNYVQSGQEGARW